MICLIRLVPGGPFALGGAAPEDTQRAAALAVRHARPSSVYNAGVTSPERPAGTVWLRLTRFPSLSRHPRAGGCEGTCRRIRSIRARSAASIVALALAGAAAPGCASQGPKFAFAPPSDSAGQIYVFRTSDIAAGKHDYGEIISIDGRDLGTLQSPGFITPGCQYLWVNVEPGLHRIVARSKSHWYNLGFIPPDPRELAVTAAPGQMHFVRVNRVHAGTSVGMSAGVGYSSSQGFVSGSGPMSISVHFDKELHHSIGHVPPQIRECHQPAE